MMEYRVRSRISQEELDAKHGKILGPDDFNVLITRATRILRPDGETLCVYLPGSIPPEMRTEIYPTLHELRKFQTDNRGAASGYKRAPSAEIGGKKGGRSRVYSNPIASAIIGAFDPAGPKSFCRLTAWTGSEAEKFAALQPFFHHIASKFQEHVPERYAVQMAVVRETQAEWVISGTPFTTVTVNNSYPTGVHQDAGDLPEGFSNVTALRRGNYSGGFLTFPEYRLAVDLQDGDTLLMDAHDWHGNTRMTCNVCGEAITHFHEECGVERISVVCYFRTKMRECGTWDEEFAKATVFADKGTERGLRLA